MNARAMLLAAAVVAAIPRAFACGVCVEDKIAATYDYAIVQRAAARGHVIVFCEITPSLDAERVRRAANAVPAIDRWSVRVSAQPAAVSFAIDAARQPLEKVLAALERQLAGATIHPVRIIAGSDGTLP